MSTYELNCDVHGRWIFATPEGLADALGRHDLDACAALRRRQLATGGRTSKSRKSALR